MSIGDALPFVWPIAIGTASVVAAADTDRFWLVIAAAAGGSALGDTGLYWLGHRYHERVQDFWPMRNRPILLLRGRVFFRRWGIWAIIVGRFSGPLRASVPIAAGVAEMPWLHFQLSNLASAVLCAVAFLYPASWGVGWVLERLY